MAKISRQESLQRREIILDVAAELYEVQPFKEINIKEIAQKLPFTRTAIYTYFDNKEEIFLALLEREYLEWEKDLEALLEGPALTRDSFAEGLAQSLASRGTLLKILAVDMASLDANSRREQLISFKSVYGRSLRLVQEILEKHFPKQSAEVNQAFVFTFFPFLYGVYPYTAVTPKQKEAMAEAQVPYRYYAPYDLIAQAIKTLMKEG